jgi:rRNA-processing protein FCF1
MQARYLDWAEGCEQQLPFLTTDLETLRMLDTFRWRMIREMTVAERRPWPLIGAELKLQISILERMLDDLEARLHRAGSGEGHVVVLDTNVLLHYQPVTELPWASIVGHQPLRLVLPLRVIEELDEKKYSTRHDLAARARRILPMLRAHVGKAGAAAPLASEVTLEVWVDSGARFRPVDADEEILAVCKELAQFGAASASIASGDTAMQLRAETLGVSTIELADKYLRVKPEPA